jgi:hypothetical protein
VCLDSETDTPGINLRSSVGIGSLVGFGIGIEISSHSIVAHVSWPPNTIGDQGLEPPRKTCCERKTTTKNHYTPPKCFESNCRVIHRGSARSVAAIAADCRREQHSWAKNNGQIDAKFKTTAPSSNLPKKWFESDCRVIHRGSALSVAAIAADCRREQHFWAKSDGKSTPNNTTSHNLPPKWVESN